MSGIGFFYWTAEWRRARLELPAWKCSAFGRSAESAARPTEQEGFFELGRGLSRL
jgi:hypothetical protein